MKPLALAALWATTAAGLGQGLPGTNVSLAATSSVPAMTRAGLTNLAGFDYVCDDKYKLRAGDRVSLQILEDQAPSKGLVVGDSGELEVPYLGRMAVADKTCKQVADELKTGLERAYYHRATVILGLDAANRVVGRAYVIGQVRLQGAVEIQVNENMTVAKAVLRAGGLAEYADKKRVKIVRAPRAPGGRGQTVVLNLAEIIEDGRVEKDLPLEPDDFVIVPTRLISF
jgi:protein involved in polysaccharide export with SLBB domain